MKRVTLIMSLVAGASVVGCGNGSGIGGSCGQVEPCGGEVVGAWKLASGCVLDSSAIGVDLSSICSTATFVVKNVGGTGQVTYDADQTYVSTGTLLIDGVLTLPTTCFAAGKTCAGLGAIYAQMMQTNSGIRAATCSTSGSACVCQLSLGGDVSESGTYSTNLTTLSTTPTGQTTASNDQYCVQGNVLHDINVDMTMPLGPMGMAKITGDLIFTKQ